MRHAPLMSPVVQKAAHQRQSSSSLAATGSSRGVESGTAIYATWDRGDSAREFVSGSSLAIQQAIGLVAVGESFGDGVPPEFPADLADGPNDIDEVA